MKYVLKVYLKKDLNNKKKIMELKNIVSDLEKNEDAKITYFKEYDKFYLYNLTFKVQIKLEELNLYFNNLKQIKTHDLLALYHTNDFIYNYDEINSYCKRLTLTTEGLKITHFVTPLTRINLNEKELKDFYELLKTTNVKNKILLFIKEKYGFLEFKEFEKEIKEQYDNYFNGIINSIIKQFDNKLVVTFKQLYNSLKRERNTKWLKQR